ncbi:MAG: MBL fold metallo-hydrolase [Gammaproteobacteria bacterium]|nr:MBL fold metallo-hydrolase [Gammaproteobacteria bacterium]
MDIQFLGAAREVTGSCFLVRSGDRQLLIDCGLIQGAPADEARNRAAFAFDPRAIDAVILTHAHLDHSGRLPLLVKAGFRGPVYTHRATRDLCQIMLKDAASLNEKDAEHENRRRLRQGKRLVEPLYSRQDAEKAMHQFQTLDYDVERKILPGVQVRLQDAGHILGSAIVELWLDEKGTRRKLVFSGDLGHAGAPILRNPESVREADLVVLESTYGDREHRSWDETIAELGEVFREAQQSQGNILIPAFAIGRSQELIYFLKHYSREWGIKDWTIFLDSPMAIEATEVYSRYWKLFDAETNRRRKKDGDTFSMPNLHFSRTAAQSMAINRVRGGAIVIAGSGMCDGGRIRHHFKHNLWREQCHVIFAGFQARGTLGRQLVDGAKTVKLWGETIRVAARIHTVGGLSAHAGQSGLLSWYQNFERQPAVALVHGEPEPMEALARRLRLLRTSVLLPEAGGRIDLLSLPRAR